MILKVFTVYDSKVEAYLSPFYMPTVASAIRAWETTVNDPSTQFSRHPADYTLFEIGTFDDATAMFEMHPAKRPLQTALEAKRPPTDQMSLLPTGSAWPTISKASGKEA